MIFKRSMKSITEKRNKKAFGILWALEMKCAELELKNYFSFEFYCNFETLWSLTLFMAEVKTIFISVLKFLIILFCTFLFFFSVISFSLIKIGSGQMLIFLNKPANTKMLPTFYIFKVIFFKKLLFLFEYIIDYIPVT